MSTLVLIITQTPIRIEPQDFTKGLDAGKRLAALKNWKDPKSEEKNLIEARPLSPLWALLSVRLEEVKKITDKLDADFRDTLGATPKASFLPPNCVFALIPANDGKGVCSIAQDILKKQDLFWHDTLIAWIDGNVAPPLLHFTHPLGALGELSDVWDTGRLMATFREVAALTGGDAKLLEIARILEQAPRLR